MANSVVEDWCGPALRVCGFSRADWGRDSGSLQPLVQAGFGKRIMFGSDQIQWPDAIARGVNAIESADFLSAEQKRDILRDTAVRFFRLDALARADGSHRN